MSEKLAQLSERFANNTEISEGYTMFTFVPVFRCVNNVIVLCTCCVEIPYWSNLVKAQTKKDFKKLKHTDPNT